MGRAGLQWTHSTKWIKMAFVRLKPGIQDKHIERGYQKLMHLVCFAHLLTRIKSSTKTTKAKLYHAAERLWGFEPWRFFYVEFLTTTWLRHKEANFGCLAFSYLLILFERIIIRWYMIMIVYLNGRVQVQCEIARRTIVYTLWVFTRYTVCYIYIYTFMWGHSYLYVTAKFTYNIMRLVTYKQNIYEIKRWHKQTTVCQYYWKYTEFSDQCYSAWKFPAEALLGQASAPSVGMQDNFTEIIDALPLHIGTNWNRHRNHMKPPMPDKNKKISTCLECSFNLADKCMQYIFSVTYWSLLQFVHVCSRHVQVAETCFLDHRCPGSSPVCWTNMFITTGQ